VYFRNSEGLKLVGVLHVPKSKREEGVIICHGFTGSKDKNFIPELAKSLEENDFLTLRFDFSGNGESEGSFEDRTYLDYVEDLKSAIDYLRNEVEKVCVIGHSMGGNIAILEYSKYKNFNHLVLLAPGIKLTKKLFTEEDMKELEQRGCIEFTDSWGGKRRLRRKYFEVRRKCDFLKEAENLDVPTLLVIGGRDGVVSVEKCEEFYRLINAPKRLEILEGENHVFHNKADKLSKIILEFLETF